MFLDVSRRGVGVLMRVLGASRRVLSAYRALGGSGYGVFGRVMDASKLGV